MVNKGLMNELEELGIGSDADSIVKYIKSIQMESQISGRRYDDIDEKYTRVITIAKELGIYTSYNSTATSKVIEVNEYSKLDIIRDILGEDGVYDLDFVLIPDGIDICIEYSNGYISKAVITNSNTNIGQYIVSLLGSYNSILSKYGRIKLHGRICQTDLEYNISDKFNSLNEYILVLIKSEDISSSIGISVYKAEFISDSYSREDINRVISEAGFLVPDHKLMQFISKDTIENIVRYVDKYFKEAEVYSKLNYVTMKLFDNNRDIDDRLINININLGYELGYRESLAEVTGISWKYNTIYVVPVLKIRYTYGRDKGKEDKLELSSVSELERLGISGSMGSIIKVRRSKRKGTEVYREEQVDDIHS